jgi:predicted nucleic-acid-binding Zn-ribbon protein
MLYKKRKVIETQEGENFIVCDNKKCDYTIPTKSKHMALEHYVNKSCPKCGENLLTETDYKTHSNLMKIINIINFLFSWTTVFIKPGETYDIDVKIHDKIKITKNDKD